MNTRVLSDKEEILSILKQDSLYAAYAIGDLEDGLFSLCHWVAAEDNRGVSALALTFNGLFPPALFLIGASEGLAAILHQGTAPAEAHLTMLPEHVSTVSRFYRTHDRRQMWRMTVDAATFRPMSEATVRLRPDDVGRVNALYSWAGDSFYAAYQLEHGVFHGVCVDGQLVAAAGTHIVAPQYGFGAVGNVYTHPEYRNRGFAKVCTSAVVADLLEHGCKNVVLNVRQGNTPAVRAYTRLGFQVYCAFIEAPGQRKSHPEQILSNLLPRRSKNDHEA